MLNPDDEHRWVGVCLLGHDYQKFHRLLKMLNIIYLSI